jgi:hypothetical protein
MMMEDVKAKPNHDGNGHTGLLDCDDGMRYWARIRRGVLELWNRPLEEHMFNIEVEDSKKYFIEREIILLYLYTFVRIPKATNEAGFMLITGTLHAEEFSMVPHEQHGPDRNDLEMTEDEDVDKWMESIDRARGWAVDKEELRQFTGGDDDNIAYEEFMEFQKKKSAERAEQLARMNKKNEKDEAKRDMQSSSYGGQKEAYYGKEDELTTATDGDLEHIRSVAVVDSDPSGGMG